MILLSYVITWLSWNTKADDSNLFLKVSNFIEQYSTLSRRQIYRSLVIQEINRCTR